jgi:putative sterol carrier protein
MRLSILLLALAQILKIAAVTNKAFKHYIRKTNAKILIKTADGEHARLFIFNKGKISSKKGEHRDFDVALVWKDAATGFSVMTSKKKDASFNAAAQGKLKVEGMSVFAQWFEDGMKLVM